MKVLVLTIVHDPEDARIRYRQIPALIAAGHHVVYAAPFSTFGREIPRGVTGIDMPRASGRRRLGAIAAANRLLRRVGPNADVVLIHDPDLLLAAACVGGGRLRRGQGGGPRDSGPKGGRLAGLGRGGGPRDSEPKGGRLAALGRVGGRRGCAPIVWDVHEDTAAALSMRSWLPGGIRPLASAAVKAAERVAEKRFSLLLAEYRYQDRFRDPHPVVPNSIMVPAAMPEAEATNRVVYLGKVSTARGGADMIELARRVPELDFHIIGPAEANLREALKQADEEGILTWCPFMPNAQALASLPGALAGLALLHNEPNYAHSLPTKMVEYMAHGVPVVATGTEASRELVEASGGGIIVPFGDIDAATAALRCLASDSGERESMRASGYHYVAKSVNWHLDGPAFVRALEAAAGRN